MPSLQNLPSGSATDEILEALDRDGALVLTGLLEPATCNSLLSDFSSHLKGVEWGVDELGYRDDFYGEHTKRLHGLFSKSRTMESVLINSELVAIATAFIVARKVATGLRLSNAELMVLSAGQAVQEFHRDASSWHRAQSNEPGEILVSANIALTPFTETNGATRVVPGSHLWESGREPQPLEVCLATMNQGSALIYSGKVIHSGGEHKDKAPRVGLYLGYSASWLRPIENHLITNSVDDVFALSPTAQELLDVSPGGYTVFA